MKELKCPLCGNKITPHYLTGEQLCGESVGGAYYFSCSHCRWSIETKRGTEELALREVEKFISKFPPIMRVQVGDFISYVSRCGERFNNAKVHEIDRDECVIRTSCGTCRSDDVTKWPWELKQKGGK